MACAVSSELERGSHSLYVLAGEIEYDGDAPVWRAAGAPDEIWREERVHAVFRLPVRALDRPALSARLVSARAAELETGRIQLDVDAPESKIASYGELLKAIRESWPKGARDLYLGATFLPCHLGLKGIEKVLGFVDEPVIQLHGIDPPKDIKDDWHLMERERSFLAVKRAVALHENFKMALPSYAYVLLFGRDGAFSRLFAEGLPVDWSPPPGMKSCLAAPDLGLVHDILSDSGKMPVIWFRLPVKGQDRFSLDRETIGLLERGVLPSPGMEFSVLPKDGGRRVEFRARYLHRIPYSGAYAEIDWGGGNGAGEFFPLNGCRIEGNAVHGRLPARIWIPPFPPGESFVFGIAAANADFGKVRIKEDIE